jgi:hypothetical protein
MQFRAVNPEDHGLITIIPGSAWRKTSTIYLVSKKTLPSLFELSLGEILKKFLVPQKPQDKSIKLMLPHLYYIEDETVFTEVPVLAIEQVSEGFGLSDESKHVLSRYVRKFPPKSHDLISSLLRAVREDKKFYLSRCKTLQLLRNPHLIFPTISIGRKGLRIVGSIRIIEDEIQKVCMKLGHPELVGDAKSLYKNYLHNENEKILFANDTVERLAAVCVYKSFQMHGIRLSSKKLCKASGISDRIFRYTLLHYSQYFPYVLKKPIVRSIIESFAKESHLPPKIIEYSMNILDMIKESEIDSFPVIVAGAILGYSIIMNNYHEGMPMYKIAQKLSVSSSSVNKQLKQLVHRNGKRIKNLYAFKNRMQKRSFSPYPVS